MPIINHKTKKQHFFIGFVFYHFKRDNYSSGKSVFVINKINKIRDISQQISGEIEIKKKFLITRISILEKRQYR